MRQPEAKPPRATSPPGRLPGWHEALVYLSYGILALSGAAWLWLHHFITVEGEFGIEPHPAELWLLRLHGVIAYLFLLIAGALIPLHIRLGWSSGRNRNTGVIVAAAAGIAALSGVGLYYIGAEAARAAASIAHWSLGLGGGAALVWHAVRGRARDGR